MTRSSALWMRRPLCSRVRGELRPGQRRRRTCPTAMSTRISALAPFTSLPPSIPGLAGSLDSVTNAPGSRTAAPSWTTWIRRWPSPSGRCLWCATMSGHLMAQTSPAGSPCLRVWWSTAPPCMAPGCITSNNGSGSSNANADASRLSPRQTTDARSLNHASAQGISRPIPSTGRRSRWRR
jgi:hypothetical protein